MKTYSIQDLTPDKRNLIEKYSLTLNENLIWEFKHGKYHTIKYFTHKFAVKESVLALLFNIHKLCYAKIKYFESNFSKYEPYKYSYQDGFVKCEIYDMSFMLHKYSNIMIDLRNLQEIKTIEEFRLFCNHLESFEYNLQDLII
ncbi:MULTISPECIES: hypothetical protein [unclassified Clostridioides]|uniref:hypothetical protein n=1 Tax=unclassified Clostridioides TaxID=2635829 RepID=UPI0007BBFF61|nr:hypothetical protein [Clostridioides sp. ZZV14-6387]MCI9975666.1 hypothetical protein [Clostridioides difficile]MDB3084452.1 hypothetical protein [Clostridioides difficile]NJJ36562.1 hypothetical protein [Clostridioides difficile]NJK13777.1 hypothetical protein [Clostridioides difficile]